MIYLSDIRVGIIVTLTVLVLLIIAGIVVFFSIVPVSLWNRANSSGVKITIKQLLQLKSHGSNIELIVDTLIMASKAGVDFTLEELEIHAMAGGNIDNVVKALISARSAGMTLTKETAKAIDLAGRNVLDAVKTSITPKVVETPSIVAVPKDGIEVKIKAHISLRANIGRYLGGADENTIIARIAEGVSTTVGSAESHKVVLENPDVIADTIMSKGLDSQTSYEIISIDIFQVELGKNIADEYQTQLFEAKQREQRAKLEEKKLQAEILEKENLAKLQESKIRAIEAETAINNQIAEALKDKSISAVDFYDIQNLKADTNLRNKISGSSNDDAEILDELKRKNKKNNPFNF